MRIGISIATLQLTHDMREGARNVVERAAAASSAGLDSLFVGDQHATQAPYYQNVPILARALAEWGSGDAGTLHLLPLWNPVLLAEQTATLASIHSGRFILQCGIGGGEAQFKAMGADIRFRPSMFETSLAILRALWAGETVDEDRFYSIQGASISPHPPEPIDVWIGASAPAAIERAARLGDAWLADPGSTIDRLKGQIAVYREACANEGRPERMALRRDVFVGESDASAREAMSRYIERGYRGIDPDALLIGSPGRVAERIHELAELGFTEVLIRNITRDQRQALECIERFAAVKEAM